MKDNCPTANLRQIRNVKFWYMLSPWSTVCTEDLSTWSSDTTEDLTIKACGAILFSNLFPKCSHLTSEGPQSQKESKQDLIFRRCLFLGNQVKTQGSYSVYASGLIQWKWCGQTESLGGYTPKHRDSYRACLRNLLSFQLCMAIAEEASTAVCWWWKQLCLFLKKYMWYIHYR